MLNLSWCWDGLHFKHGGLHLGPEPRRVTCVAVKIPPLPYGPLSVAWFVEVGSNWMEVKLDGSNLANIRGHHLKWWWKGIRNPPQNPLRNYSNLPSSVFISLSTSDVIESQPKDLPALFLEYPLYDLHDTYNPHKALHVISLGPLGVAPRFPDVMNIIPTIPSGPSLSCIPKKTNYINVPPRKLT